MKKNSNALPNLIIITGPTAVGKTSIAIELARKLKTEIISADSMQIYQNMTIGTAMPTNAEQQLAKHHLIDFVNPSTPYSVANYASDARNVIKELINKGKTPIITGGTGLYLHSLIYKMDFSTKGENLAIRTDIEKYLALHGPLALHQLLKEKSPETALKIHPNNTRKVSRALEVFMQSGALRDFREAPTRETNYNTRLYVLNRKRSVLYDRINFRVDQMIKVGLIEEVSELLKSDLTSKHTSMKGIGYKETIEYLNDELTIDELSEKIKQNSRRYAKRQITWMKRYNFAHWIRINTNTNRQNVIQYIIEREKEVL